MSFSFHCEKGAPLRVLTELATCCYGAAEYGPHRCTCWEPEYDLDQTEPDLDPEPGTRSKMCHDCAFRPSSPERTGDDRYAHSEPGDLSDLDGTFWCHQGMRKAVRWRHPAGIVIEVQTDNYRPPLRLRPDSAEVVPYRADGQPGERCAGWAAHYRDRDTLPIEAPTNA